MYDGALYPACCCIAQRLERICDVERVKCEDGAIDQVLSMSQGDMRKAITALQSSAQYNSGVVTKEAIVDLWGQPTDELMDQLWQAMASGSLDALEVSPHGSRCMFFLLCFCNTRKLTIINTVLMILCV
jgi:hypothetical protein